MIGGLGFFALGWFIDFWTHVEKFGVAAGAHVHGGEALIRVNIPLTGVPFLLLGMAQLIGTEALLKRGGTPVFLGSHILMLDGVAHAFAFNDHLGDPVSAAFFAFVAPAQIAAGLAMPFIARRFDVLLALSSAALLALYAVSRSVALPALGWPERVEGLDMFSKAMEVLFILCVVASLHAQAVIARAKSTAPAGEAPAKPAGP